MIAGLFWICVGSIVYTYAGYPAILALVARFRPEPGPFPPAEPLVTLLVAAYNEEAEIARKLENSLALDYPADKLQILIVADGSSDNTPQIVREYADRGVELLYSPPRRGKMAAINRAIHEARGEIVLFSDANNRYDPDVVRELLPPPLLPAPTPRVTVSVSDIGRSNCVGPFRGANVNIACLHEGVEGVYGLMMPMSTDTAVIFGRELYAEPKKLADITLEAGGDGRARGTVTRHGVTYMELRGHFEEPMAEVNRESVSSHYYVKFMPSADGRGFAHEPELIRVTHRGRTRRFARGNGTVTFRESIDDPLIDIPVLAVTGAALVESDTYTSAEVVCVIPAETFLPYAFGKIDSLSEWAISPEAAFSTVA